ncbi:type IX secretion system sortase PorU [Flavobacterium gawalongense]|uniref:Type IX secretion system sortase PorU n=1 Tax=Flavobacterium gawalongense TaxID=2594432 RepID=A0A553BF72_9FLAO|nr:type IX secretion system sortase PorU [Flavobacterium gawalongense]TRW99749.1 type IX secretion system sortase PorU [Flavobacterium gawalongense]TRX03864.1 type IX secretion system sortase PorU [Flavobacterium gawalongense]TRX06891.1 type IX secretion system sortase PorU [Flavobacterium gawalongense]TRX07614.1 type IX secretion system sortase PorU [Flavobacterium gawalongense]TRX23490.1 type IX secretion system sortase PorU [Flavobacterium gawalongense]
MRKILLVYLSLIPFVSFAQIKGDMLLEWLEKKEISFGDFKINVPQFSGNNYYYDVSKKALFYTLSISESASFNENDLQISNIVYESILTSQLGELALENIPKTPNASLKITNSRDIRQAFLSLSPIVKDDFGYKRIKSFSYNIKSSSSKISQSNKSTNVVYNSILASGDWYQFYIEKSGVYKISKNFLQQLGLNMSSIDPKKIKIYGNGGKMLPLSNSIYYPQDITENPIQIIGESDGVFDNDDAILFYAEGLDIWNEESQTFNNLYDTKSYYYITVHGDDGKRIPEMTQPSGNSSVTLNTFDDHQYHELDLVNIAHLGRQWFGESFDINQEQEFEFNFPNYDSTTPIKIMTTTASAAFTPTSFKVAANGQEIGNISFQPLNSNSDIEFNLGFLPSNTSFNGSENVKIKLTYNNNGVPGSKGYLDNIRLIAKRKLQGYGKQFHFQYDLSNSSLGIVSYSISNANGISQVWDVTDLYNVTKIENSNQSSFTFKANLGELRKYIAIDPADYFTPLKDSKTKIVNQNLKGTLFKNAQSQFQDVDYVIIAPNFLTTQAEKLAGFHRINSNLNVKVISLESIYQEFSSGKQDISAIRNCVKYIYENASTPEKRIKYVNLFGDASYDFKNRIVNNSNIVPIYHSLRSNTSGEASFASDDFYGLMDSNEGNIISYFGGIDIAVGRMLVNDTKQADEMANKIIEYHDLKSYGSWRNNFVLISDDSDKSSDASLQTRQNNLADIIASEKPFLNVNKIILDSYVQEASAGGFRYPKAGTDFFNAFEKGALVFNYLGHGGEDGLSSERIWEKSDGQKVSNQYKYPLFITITCEFSRFDNPSRPTAGEYTYWNPKGGAIAMITTTRSIGQYSAENFNDILSKNLLSFGSNPYTSIAEALRISKNSNPNSATNVVFYIGDPALMLDIPKPKISLTKVNDVSISQPIDDFKSLAKIKLTGEITDENNNPLTNYNGEVSTTIFDKIISRTTFNNDGTSTPINFNVLGETIFRGNASVTNGKFEFSFVVPRDIRIPLANGRISFYAKKNQILENQTGYNTTIKVGGINENAVADNISPRVKLYMNDETFVSGGTTNESPFLLAFLEDENGINTASGIGHDIVAIVDGDVNNPYILNDYYQTKLDDYTNGTLRFPLRNLSVGLHTISFKAWDVYNNPISTEIQFIVVGDETLTLTHVLNYPNPFVNYTEFWFTHNRPYEALDVQVQVMTITGKVVWTKNQIVLTEGFLSKEITWDGKDDFGSKIGKGVYVYKLTVKSNLTNKKTEKFEKLVIL